MFCRNMLKDLVKTYGSPDVLLLSLDVSYKRAELYLQEIDSVLRALPEIPAERSNSFYPIDAYFNHERFLYKDTIHQIKSDVALLQKVVSGNICINSETRELLDLLSVEEVPPLWVRNSFSPGISVKRWIHGFSRMIQLFSGYINEEEPTITYNLAAFHRPEQFLQATLQTYARKEFKDFNNFSFTVEVQSNITFIGYWIQKLARV